jgi:hypothetical protein
MKKFFLFIFLLLLPYSVIAQIPNGSILWLKAENGVTQIGRKVQQWMDQSNGKLLATQLIPENQPELIDDGINHLPVIRFNGINSYLNGPATYPVHADYTVSIILSINNFSLTNSILAGATHEIYLNGGKNPIVMHGDFSAQSFSSIPITDQPTIITLVFRQSSQFASFYINGQFADSSYIGTNNDSTIYIGSIRNYSLMSGDLAEIIFYNKILSMQEQSQLENYLSTKYAIPISYKKDSSDSTFTEIPQQLQFLSRDAQDSAIMPISGNIYKAGFDSIYLKVNKNGFKDKYQIKSLQYKFNKAFFSFQPKIHAELSEYKIEVGIKSKMLDTIIAIRDSIVCGDAILIDGQSNAINNNLNYTNEFFRTFGRNFSQNYGDTLWAIASTSVNFGGGTEVGSWGLRIQELIKDTYHIPTCIINGGVPGTIIEQHLPDPHLHDNHRNIYGSMLYRAKKAKLTTRANVLYWYQGEWNTIKDYNTNFHTLYEAWKSDYPNVKKIYVIQPRMGCSPDSSQILRNLIRTFQDSFINVETVATMGLPGHDGCHFSAEGYLSLGDQLFRLYDRDFHNAFDTIQISSPNIREAFFTDSSHTKIGLVFSPKDTRFNIPKDTIINGVEASILDYFYLNDSSGFLKSIAKSNNTLYLDLIGPTNASFINYLPDKYYNNTSVVYEGPWLTNTRNIGAFSFFHIPIIDSTKSRASIRNNSEQMFMEAYPNPSNGNFTIRIKDELSINKKKKFFLTDLIGRKIELHNFDKDEISIELINLPNGIYIGRLLSDNADKTIKISVHR